MLEWNWNDTPDCHWFGILCALHQLLICAIEKNCGRSFSQRVSNGVRFECYNRSTKPVNEQNKMFYLVCLPCTTVRFWTRRYIYICVCVSTILRKRNTCHIINVIAVLFHRRTTNHKSIVGQNCKQQQKMKAVTKKRSCVLGFKAEFSTYVSTTTTIFTRIEIGMVNVCNMHVWHEITRIAQAPGISWVAESGTSQNGR